MNGNRRQEVGNICAWSALESHILKVLLRGGSRTVVDLTSLGEDEHLVELGEDTVTSLVEGCHDGFGLLIRQAPKKSSKVESIACIETPCGIVPALDEGLGSQHFRKGNSLSFTSGHAPDKLVSNNGIAGMFDAE